MIIIYECDVESKTKLEGTRRIEYGDIYYTFYLNEEGYMDKIAIETKPVDPELYYTKVVPSKEDPSISDLVINIDVEFEKDIIEQFQFLEGMFGLKGNLRRIHWQSPRITYIGETDEEKEQVKGLPHQIVRLPRENDQQVSDMDLAQLVMG